ncbi:MAG TPA: BMP family ABC transporter substrate-binding protein [Clostridia bacterium]|nr:BMP family ABC transporter substrate-binding protein [Clostridia bacterium]
MKRLLSLVTVVLLCAALVLGGCSSQGGSGGTDTGDAGEKKLKVALILSGPANDQGWNAIALAGLEAAEEEYGIETAYMENVDIADSEAAFADYAAQGYDLVIGHGFQFGDPAVKVAKNFPNTYFMATEAASQAENMASYVMSCEEGAYLMGVLCASMSQNGKLGVVGGFEQPSIVKEVEAFKVGAKSVNPDVVVYEAYISSYTDVTAGKAAAEAMIDQGADVLYHVANQAGTGVIKAAEKHGLLACGNSYDQYSIAPNTVMCSTVYNMPQVILTAVKHVREGSFGGGIFYLGMDDGVVDIAPFNGFEDKIPAETKQLISDLKAQIIEGTLQVPRIETPTR